jgi:hypothetical protein
MKKLIKYEREINNGKNPKGEDFINKNDLLSNDIFCIVFTTLTLCNSDFITLFKFRSSLNKKLVDFDKENFHKMMERYFYLISHDQVLIDIIKKLLDFSKYNKGRI